MSLEKKEIMFSAQDLSPALFPFFFPAGPISPPAGPAFLLPAQSSRPSCLPRPAPSFPLSSHADRAAPPVGVLFLLARASPLPLALLEPRRCRWTPRPSKPSRRGPFFPLSRSAPASDPAPPLHACLARTRVGRGHASPGVLDPHVETDHGAL